MGRWKYFHVLVLLLSAYYLVFYTFQYRAITGESSPEVVKTVGPWQVALAHPRKVVPGTTATVGVRFVCQGCQPITSNWCSPSGPMAVQRARPSS